VDELTALLTDLRRVIGVTDLDVSPSVGRVPVPVGINLEALATRREGKLLAHELLMRRNHRQRHEHDAERGSAG
jgi:hypothetical protein